MPINYQKAQIYMIESMNHNLRYYGSTCSPLHKRFYGHKAAYKCFKNGKHNRTTSFDVLDCKDVKIILVEAFPCSNKSELTAREAWYIRNNECVNKNIPGRTVAEYYLDNKEKFATRSHLYNIKNKDKVAIQKKNYYQNNKELVTAKANVKITCECGSIVRKCVIRRHERTKKHFDQMNIYVV